MAIKTQLEQLGYESAHLDDLVHDVASELASNINNDGMSNQLEFLITTCGWSEERILAALENADDVED